MKKKYLVIVIIVFLIVIKLFFFRGDRSKRKYSHTNRICNKGLFVETYKIFESGALGGDRISEYLTDSINFRVYIGTLDNGHEVFIYDCLGDSVFIKKFQINEEGAPYNTKAVYKLVDSKEYNLFDLKKKNVFD